jgi:hypothetical protein
VTFGPQRTAWLMVCVVAAGFATPGVSGLLFVTVFYMSSAVISIHGLMIGVSLVLSLILCAFFGAFRRVENWRAAAGIAAASVAVGIAATFTSYYAFVYFWLRTRH